MEYLSESVQKQFWQICRMFEHIANRTPLALVEVRDKFENNLAIYAPVSDEDLENFNNGYFFRNALKVLVAIESCEIDIASFSMLRDAGCGVGTAAIAALASGNSDDIQIDLLLEDRNQRQLNSARSNVSIAVESDLFANHRNVSSGQDISPYVDGSITIGSYIVCELLAQGESINDIVRLLRRQYLLIDYGRIISEYLREGIYQIENAKLSRLTYKLPPQMHSLIGQSTIRVNSLYVW